jgi:hypothetical protein
MKNPIVSIPLTDSDKSLLDKLQANDGFKLLLACLKAEMDENLLTGAYVRVDTPTPNGKEESEQRFKEAEIYQEVLRRIESIVKRPRTKETKYL